MKKGGVGAAAANVQIATLVDKDEVIAMCPVKHAPICPEGRARSLPGFHLLSIDAATEAVKTGSYTAFGQEHIIEDFEVLHPEDTLFICDLDHKVFLNKGSLLYHNFLMHEMQTSLRDKKRLRDAAERRKRQREELLQQRQAQQTATPNVDMTNSTTTTAAHTLDHQGFAERATGDRQMEQGDVPFPSAATLSGAAVRPPAGGAKARPASPGKKNTSDGKKAAVNHKRATELHNDSGAVGQTGGSTAARDLLPATTTVGATSPRGAAKAQVDEASSVRQPGVGASTGDMPEADGGAEGSKKRKRSGSPKAVAKKKNLLHMDADEFDEDD
ncbi:unnamed protein product [Amoebophrya sp. A120]|nr:unnamed protein product [Amoebophrya sp. A120]|eukprot:GSA120T00000119001.1